MEKRTEEDCTEAHTLGLKEGKGEWGSGYWQTAQPNLTLCSRSAMQLEWGESVQGRITYVKMLEWRTSPITKCWVHSVTASFSSALSVSLPRASAAKWEC